MKKQFLVMALSDIVPYENNPRINDEAVADVVESIRQCENLDPIEIDENNVILSGHTRLKALQELGFEKTEVMKYTGLTEEQKKKYRLLANKTGEKAEWDFSKLEKELEGLDFGDFDFGFGADNGGDSEADTGGGADAEPTADTNFNYSEQYGVIVMCADEAEQEKIYNRLTDEGYQCKVVAV